MNRNLGSLTPLVKRGAARNPPLCLLRGSDEEVAKGDVSGFTTL